MCPFILLEVLVTHRVVKQPWGHIKSAKVTNLGAEFRVYFTCEWLKNTTNLAVSLTSAEV